MYMCIYYKGCAWSTHLLSAISIYSIGAWDTVSAADSSSGFRIIKIV